MTCRRTGPDSVSGLCTAGAASVGASMTRQVSACADVMSDADAMDDMPGRTMPRQAASCPPARKTRKTGTGERARSRPRGRPDASCKEVRYG